MTNYILVGIIIISLQWVVQVRSLPLFEEVNFKRNFEFNFKPIHFKPIEFAIEKITPFKQFSLKHVIGKRYADDRPRSMEHMSRLPYEVYEDDLEPSSSEYEPVLPPFAVSVEKPKPETPPEEKPILLHTDIGKSEPIKEYLQSAQTPEFLFPGMPINEKELEKEHSVPIIPKVPTIKKPIVLLPPIIKPLLEREKPKVVALEKEPVGAVPPLLSSLLPELKLEVPNTPLEKQPLIVEPKPLIPLTPPVLEEPHAVEPKPIEPVPPVEPNPVEKLEPEAPKPVIPPAEAPSPILRGSRLALYFGNILLEVLSQVLMSARTSLSQFASPLAAM